MKIIGYSRVSSDEQASGFSLNAQEDAIERYCKNNGHDLISVYKEDNTGFKDFNRPQWNKIEEYLKKNKGSVEAILCVRWDRYSRNEPEAKKKMIELRKKYKIEIITIENYTNPDNVEGDFLNSIHLHMAQMESKRNSLRTIDGVRQGLKSGYWMHKAPFGYLNVRDEFERSTMAIDPKNGKIVKEAFEMMAKGMYSREEVRHNLIKKYKIEMCKNNFANLLKKIVYTGKIWIKPYKDEPEKIVRGVHPPIISEELFSKVQLILSGKTPKMVFHQDKINKFPLKSFVKCAHHDRKLTASSSRSRNKSLHDYYHCQGGQCPNRFKAKDLDVKVSSLLGRLEVRDEVIKAYKAVLEDVFNKKQQLYTSDTNTIEKQIKELKSKIDLIDEKFINQEIDSMAYNKLSAKLNKDQNELETILSDHKDEKVPFSKLLNEGVHLLPSIRNFYELADGKTKQRIVGSILDGKIEIENKEVRTTPWKQVILHLINLDKDFETNRKEKAGKITGSFTLAPLMHQSCSFWGT
jgi:DNA invertase Pin-like site-specific DNA recombinase